MVIHSPDGIPIGTPAMVFSMLWGELRLPYEPGVHRGVSLLADGYYVAYAGYRVPVRILVDYRVETAYYVSESAPGYDGLRSLAESASPLTARMVGRWFSPSVIRRTWRRVESVEHLERRRKVRLTVLDVLA